MRQLAAIVLIFFALGACAEDEEPILRVGLEAGLVIGNASLTPSTSSSSRIGYSLGPVADFHMGSGVFFETALLLSSYGYKVSTASINYNSIELPLIFRYRIDTGGVVRPFVALGIAYGFRTSDTFATTDSSSTNLTSSTESSGVNFLLGAGLEFDVGDGVALVLHGRYAIGLNDLDKTSAVVKNSSALFFFGLRSSL